MLIIIEITLNINPGTKNVLEEDVPHRWQNLCPPLIDNILMVTRHIYINKECCQKLLICFNFLFKFDPVCFEINCQYYI
jgi:hypothetical protein